MRTAKTHIALSRTPLYSGNTLTTDASAAWNALSKAQKKAVNLALLFGKSGSSSSLVGTDGQKWIATQLVVWEFSAQAVVTLLRSSSAIPSLLTITAITIRT